MGVVVLSVTMGSKVTLSFLCCCFTMDAVFSLNTTAYLANLPPEGKAKIYFAMTPEVVENFILLLLQDRLALKTILTNAVLFYENCVIDMTLEAYNATVQAGLCSAEQGRLKRDLIQNQKKKLEAEVDSKIDALIGEWISRKTQEDLESYRDAFWKDRNELYRYVTNKNGYCKNDQPPCTGWGKLELAYTRSFYALSMCKLNFWPSVGNEMTISTLL